jgi:hypothetical protein
MLCRMGMQAGFGKEGNLVGGKQPAVFVVM